MTDRVSHLTVVLNRTMRDDDVQGIVSAIKLIKGVQSVGTHVAAQAHYVAIEQAKHDISMKILELIV